MVPSESIVDQVHHAIRKMAITYQLKPGERVNEVELSRQLGVSRTPLREALNRLNTEGLLTFAPGKGFFCRHLDPKEVFDLYEVRKVLETSAIHLSVQRARTEQIDALDRFLRETGQEANDRTAEELVGFDEYFHEHLIAMSGNDEMLRMLKNLNSRIQFVRWIDIDSRKRSETQAEHRAVLSALRKRDEATCTSILEAHIDRRLDQITSVIKRGIAEIYLRGMVQLDKPLAVP
jgi:DNA-binding GntR family transcriptional regulator